MKKNILFLATALATIPAIVVSQPANVEAATSIFKDIPKTSPYYIQITDMANLKIISGYEDNTFRPNEVITRKHAAALVNRAKSLPQTVKYVKFKDVSEKSPNFNDIKALQQAGIFTPDAKGNFNPNKALTRAEMAKVLVMAFDLEVKVEHNFPDVPTSSAYSKYVQAIYSNGITTGDDGKFLPGESLSRAHYAVFMHRAMNMDENFVAPPIVKPTPTPKPDPKPEKPGVNTGLDTDNYGNEADVPRPPGYVSGKHEEKQQQELKETGKQNQHGGAGAFSIIPAGNDTVQYINSVSKSFGITATELTRIINNAVKTGETYSGGKFALYYNYSTGKVVFSEK